MTKNNVYRDPWQVIIDIQSVAAKLGRDGKQRLEAAVAHSSSHCTAATMGLLLPTGKPLPQWDGRSWVACFVQWFFGDATWNLDRDEPLLFEEWASMLQNREELQYDLPDDTTPYQARPRSRFMESGILACQGDLQRRLAMLTGTRAAFARQGFEQDVRLIAEATSQEFEAAFSLIGPKAHSTDALSHPGVAAPVKQALRSLLLSSAKVPGTEGNKTMQRYHGNALTTWFGPAVLFLTFNFADTYSRIVVNLDLGPAGGADQPADRTSYTLLTDEPDMPSLADMHRIVARNPRAQAKFFLLMEELGLRYCCGLDELYIGRTHLARQFDDREDDAAGSLQPSLVRAAASAMGPGEHQGRGFEHAHVKVHSKVRGMTVQWLRETMAGTDEEASSAARALREALIRAASTIQYDSAVAPAKQLDIDVPAEPFTAKQQRQSRMDGGTEIDGSTREFLPVREEELQPHLQRELRRAAAESRRPTVGGIGFKTLSLKGALQSVLPGWRRLCGFARWFTSNEPLGAAQPRDAPDDSACLGALPVVLDADGSIQDFILPDGTVANPENDLPAEARQWAHAFAHEARALQCSTSWFIKPFKGNLHRTVNSKPSKTPP